MKTLNEGFDTLFKDVIQESIDDDNNIDLSEVWDQMEDIGDASTLDENTELPRTVAGMDLREYIDFLMDEYSMSKQSAKRQAYLDFNITPHDNDHGHSHRYNFDFDYDYDYDNDTDVDTESDEYDGLTIHYIDDEYKIENESLCEEVVKSLRKDNCVCGDRVCDIPMRGGSLSCGYVIDTCPFEDYIKVQPDNYPRIRCISKSYCQGNVGDESLCEDADAKRYSNIVQRLRDKKPIGKRDTQFLNDHGLSLRKKYPGMTPDIVGDNFEDSVRAGESKYNITGKENFADWLAKSQQRGYPISTTHEKPQSIPNYHSDAEQFKDYHQYYASERGGFNKQPENDLVHNGKGSYSSIQKYINKYPLQKDDRIKSASDSRYKKTLDPNRLPEGLDDKDVNHGLDKDGYVVKNSKKSKKKCKGKSCNEDYRLNEVFGLSKKDKIYDYLDNLCKLLNRTGTIASVDDDEELSKEAEKILHLIQNAVSSRIPECFDYSQYDKIRQFLEKATDINDLNQRLRKIIYNDNVKIDKSNKKEALESAEEAFQTVLKLNKKLQQEVNAHSYASDDALDLKSYKKAKKESNKLYWKTEKANEKAKKRLKKKGQEIEEGYLCEDINNNGPSILKYRFLLNGGDYYALFVDKSEANQFMRENEEDGSSIKVASVEELTPYEALTDREFDESYAAEIVCAVLFPNEHFSSSRECINAAREYVFSQDNENDDYIYDDNYDDYDDSEMYNDYGYGDGDDIENESFSKKKSNLNYESLDDLEEDVVADGEKWKQGKDIYDFERRSRDEKNSILSKGAKWYTGEGTEDGKKRAKQIRDFGTGNGGFYDAEDYYKANLSTHYADDRREHNHKSNSGKQVG